MKSDERLGRRVILAGGIVLLGNAALGQPEKGQPEKKGGKAEGGKGEEEVSPNEDLMREHGLLNRMLLIYEEGIRRIGAKQDLDPAAVQRTATIIRDFVEDYHEKLEENYLFPRLEKAGKQVVLVKTLREQHAAGRGVTERILGLATVGGLKDPSSAAELSAQMAAFVRMYRPHESREDTVLFPAFKEVVSRNEYDALGEDFEKEEHRRFGEGGFEEMVARVEKIEKDLGIYELGQFTPRVDGEKGPGR